MDLAFREVKSEGTTLVEDVGWMKQKGFPQSEKK